MAPISFWQDKYNTMTEGIQYIPLVILYQFKIGRTNNNPYTKSNADCTITKLLAYQCKNPAQLFTILHIQVKKLSTCMILWPSFIAPHKCVHATHTISMMPPLRKFVSLQTFLPIPLCKRIFSPKNIENYICRTSRPC